MPVNVKCTGCGLEMSAPDSLVGKHATCPKCRARLPVGIPAPGSPVAGSIKPSVAPPPAPSAAGVALAAPKSMAVANSPSASPPVGTQSAKFIIADATARRIELGASGQLPKLVLDEAQKKEVPEEKTSGSKTWVLLVAVAGSVGMSILMLFLDMSSPNVGSASKDQARKDVLERYVQKLPPDKKCLEYLSKAIQAYNRGDLAEERANYRVVLDMLHMQGKDPSEGITGAVRTPAGGIPNDTELEELLSILMRE